MYVRTLYFSHARCSYLSKATRVSGLRSMCDVNCSSEITSTYLLIFIVWLVMWVHSYTICCLNLTCRPDKTFAVDWALSNNYLSIFQSHGTFSWSWCFCRQYCTNCEFLMTLVLTCHTVSCYVTHQSDVCHASCVMCHVSVLCVTYQCHGSCITYDV